MSKFIKAFLIGAVIASASVFCVYADNAGMDDPSSMGSWSYSSDSNVFVNDKSSQTGVSMEMSYGYRNIAKSGHKLPFSVTIHNYEAEDIKGELVIEAPGSVQTGRDAFDAVLNRYVYPVSISAGTEVKVDNLISIAEENKNIRLALYNGSRLISEKWVPVFISAEGSDLLIGILSDTPEKLEYFDGISVAQAALRTKTIELIPEELPGTALELEQLDIIAISNLDMKRLSPEIIGVLEGWTQNGGVLLVGSGNNNKAAETFGAYLEDFSISEPHQENVDMGMKYSKTGPDGAILDLNVCDISVPQGIQVMQSSDIAMLTTVNGINGVTAFSAYDLCDINEFCQQEMSYTEELLKNLLGSSRIEKLANSVGSSREIFEGAGEFLDIEDPSKLPSILVYALFAIAYLVFIGGVLYIWLRRRGLELYYHSFVIISAFAGAFVIWIIGSGYRGYGLKLNYAAVREIYNGSCNESGFIRLLSTSADDYRISLPDNYEVYPIAREVSQTSVLTGKYKSSDLENQKILEFQCLPGEKTISSSKLGPFAGSKLEFSGKSHTETEGNSEATLTAQLGFYNEQLSGMVRNDSDYDLEDAAILLYGRIIKLGEIKAHSELNLKDYVAVNGPTSGADTLAAYVTNLDSYASGTSEYVRELKRARYLTAYLQDSPESHYGGARLVAFSKNEKMLTDIGSNLRAEVDGTLLLVCFADTSFTKGTRSWRNALSTDPVIISGDYEIVSNTAMGSTVLEYSLGSDIVINSLYFTELSEEFENDSLKRFQGQISLYNYESGVYEYIGDKRSFKASEIRPYLSPSNTIMVRYLPGEGNSGKAQFLPVPNVLGAER